MSNIKIKELESILADRFHGVLEGAQSDINTWVAKIATNMVEAASENDEEAHEMLLHQLEALAARHEVEANQAAWGFVKDTVLYGIKLITTVA